MFRHFIAILLLISPMVQAELLENPDQQSPEEITAARLSIEREFSDAQFPEKIALEKQMDILTKYSYLDPHAEIRPHLLKETLVFFEQNQTKFRNKKYVTIVDFGLSSDRHRIFIVNLENGSVEKYRTTHGAGSDSDDDGWAERFGNVVNSGMSSLGFARTAEVYSGRFGRSLRLDGLSTTNSRMRERAVVYHGWDYVKEAPVKQGLSLGCITLDWRFKDAVLDKIKEGSLIYTGR